MAVDSGDAAMTQDRSPIVPTPARPRGTQIDRIEVIPVEVPRLGGFSLSRGQTPATSPHTIVRITTGDGVVGYGEGATQMRGLYTIVRDHLAPALVGMEASDLT